MRKLLIALLCLLPLPALALTDQDRADIARVEQYLNGIRTMTADFLQVGSDGGIAEGKLWLRRPGRIRFEYEPPVPILIVSDGILIGFYDKELGQADSLPLGSTPLAVLLRDDIKLGGAVTVQSVERGPGLLRVTLFETGKRQEGQITLVFSEQPFQLRQWEVTDAVGQVTKITLSNQEFGQPLPQRLFVLSQPPRRGSGAP